MTKQTKPRGKGKAKPAGRPKGRGKATQGKGFLDNLKKGLDVARQVSEATGIKPSDLLSGSRFGSSSAGNLGAFGLSALGLGKKKAKRGKGKPRARKKGGCAGKCTCGAKRGMGHQGGCGIFDFLGDALGSVSDTVSGIAGKVLNPFARTALPLLAGVAQAGAPLAGALPALFGAGKRKRGGRQLHPSYGVNANPHQASIGVVRF